MQRKSQKTRFLLQANQWLTCLPPLHPNWPCGRRPLRWPWPRQSPPRPPTTGPTSAPRTYSHAVSEDFWNLHLAIFFFFFPLKYFNSFGLDLRVEEPAPFHYHFLWPPGKLWVTFSELDLIISLLNNDFPGHRRKPGLPFHAVICIFLSCGRNGELRFHYNLKSMSVSKYSVISRMSIVLFFFAAQKLNSHAVLNKIESYWLESVPLSQMCGGVPWCVLLAAASAVPLVIRKWH